MNASWIAIDLMDFAVQTEEAIESAEKALKWLRSFRDTLLMDGRNSRPMPWAVELLGMADVKIAKKSIARMQGQIVKIYGKDCDVDLECSKKYGEKYEKLKNIIAAATTREGVDVVSDRESGSLERATGCNPLTADAPHREAGENVTDGSNSGTLESGTSANNMRRVPQNEAPAHGFSGGRTAQGTMSRSPEAAAQSGKAYDQETIEISTNKRRTGGPSLSQTSSLPPVRQSEPDVMSLAYSGEFGNVRLTQEQYAQLGIKFGNQQKLNRAIDSLSCQIENGEKNPQNHYAELVKWASYRDDMEEKEELRASSAPHYETVSEHNMRVLKKSTEFIMNGGLEKLKNGTIGTF
jgi:hypothetical protein